MQFKSLSDAYILARWFYLLGEPLMSDTEYDKIEKQFKQEFPTSPYSTRPWSFDECPTQLLTDYNLTSYIKNLKMGYAAESIPSVNTKPEFEERFRSLSKHSRLSYKVDGWNTRISYYDGHPIDISTRGRSGSNLNIQSIYKLFPASIPVKGRAYVTGELSIPNNMWAAFKEATGNRDQRSSVRTAIAEGMHDFLCFRAFNFFTEDETVEGDPYKILEEWGFTTPTYMWVDSYAELIAGVDKLSKLDAYNDVLTDGLVIENSDYQLAIRLGRWEEDVMCSYVTGYTEMPGMWGNALNVSIHPITREGKTFTEVSVVNLATIVENELEIGAPIVFSLRSAANVVIDPVATFKLQSHWKGHYKEYQTEVNSK